MIIVNKLMPQVGPFNGKTASTKINYILRKSKYRDKLFCIKKGLKCKKRPIKDTSIHNMPLKCNKKNSMPETNIFKVVLLLRVTWRTRGFGIMQQNPILAGNHLYPWVKRTN